MAEANVDANAPDEGDENAGGGFDEAVAEANKWAAVAAKERAAAAAKQELKEAAKSAKQARKDEKRKLKERRRHLKRQQQRRRQSMGPFDPTNNTPLAEGAAKAFSLRDRHTIALLAERFARGENVEFHLWTELRAALRGNLQNLHALVTEFESLKAKAGHFDEFENHCVYLIEQVINGEQTLDEALQELVVAPTVDLRTLHLFLSRGGDANVVMDNGLRPLHICCLRSLPRATHILLEYNADFTLACEAGYTPLHYACLSGDAECAGMLKRMGASLQAINRAGHMPLECADSTGYPILRTVLDRAINLRDEALVRAKRFYVKQMEGHPDYLGPADKRSKAFHDDRVIAAVMVLAPSFISGVRERKRLVPADLDMLERLALKALGPTFEAKIERWQYDHPKYYSRIAKVIFEGQLTSKEVAQCLQDGEDRYEAAVAEAAAAAEVRAFEKSFEDFVSWLRVEDVVHQRYIQYHVAQLCEAQSKICRLHVDTIVEATTPFSVYQWEALNFEERGVLAELRHMYEERSGHLFAEAVESSSEEEVANKPKTMGAAARRALQAALEEGERLDLEQEQADERKERHDRGSFTASTYTAGSTLGTSRSIKTGRSMA